MTMTYKAKDGKEYVASQSLDQRLRRTEIMLALIGVMMFLFLIVMVIAAWQIDRNNMLHQIKEGLEVCRIVGVID